MTSATIDPRAAADLIEAGARLVDIREADEHAREHIAAARSMPLSRLASLGGDEPIIFHCRTGHRTRLNQARLAAISPCPTYLLEGGIDGWKAAGLPIVSDARQPLELMRQVQIIGGGLVMLSIVLGWLVSPLFLLLGAGVGSGMLHAGLSGNCAMTRLLAPLPWNRPNAPGHKGVPA